MMYGLEEADRKLEGNREGRVVMGDRGKKKGPGGRGQGPEITIQVAET